SGHRAAPGAHPGHRIHGSRTERPSGHRCLPGALNMLTIKDLNVFYGDSQVLHDLSLELRPAESLAIMGRNGMGKTTLLKSLIGLLPARSGSILLEGRELKGMKSYERVAAGL